MLPCPSCLNLAQPLKRTISSCRSKSSIAAMRLRANPTCHIPAPSTRRGFSVCRACNNADKTASKLTTKAFLPRREILTLLHKTDNFLPRVLLSPNPWTASLHNVYQDLNSQSNSPARVVVYGMDEWSGAQDLVTALLEEPFSSDSFQSEYVRGRWRTDERSITLDEGQSSYLRHFALPVRLTEVRPPSHPNTARNHPNTIEPGDVTSLVDADIPIIVCNPLTTPLHTLFSNPGLPWHNPRVIVVLTSSGTLPPLAHLISVTPPTAHGRQVAPELKSRLHKLKILTIDPLRALGALNTLKASPTSATAIQRYQDDFLGSGISSLSHTLSEYLDFTEPDPCGDNLHLRATTQLRGSLDACKSFLSTKKADLDVVVSGVSELRREIANVEEGLSHKIFDIPQNADPATRSEGRAIGEVERSLKDSEQAMKLVMGRLTWWRMVSQVDEIGTVVADSVARTWCRDLDAKLLIHTGNLTYTQEHLTSTTMHLLRSLPLSSPVLLNTLLQTSSSPTYPLTPTTLTAPLHRRRAQIIEYPTTRLQLAAQRVTIGVLGSAGAGAGVSWAGWVGWLAESGVFGMPIGGTTALGVGVLSTLVGVRWAVGRWEKAKKRWWEDWHRVGDGLARDLKSNLSETISSNIVIVPHIASKKLLELVEKRKNEIADLEDELDDLEIAMSKLEGKEGN
ncbi:hypothetical protein PTI98_006248 [Pleurotus ostreatus]|nr:hypothetical protein PTI98_006248 [Pleurotus ostreatus]